VVGNLRLLLKRTSVRPKPLTLVSGGELKVVIEESECLTQAALTLASGGELKVFIEECECSIQAAYFGKWWGT